MSKIFKNELSDYKMTMGQLKSIQYNNPWSDDIAKYEFIDFDLKPENLIKKGGIRVSYPYHSAMDIMGTKIKFPFNEESPDNFKPDDTIVNEKFDKLDRKNTKRTKVTVERSRTYWLSKISEEDRNKWKSFEETKKAIEEFNKNVKKFKEAKLALLERAINILDAIAGARVNTKCDLRHKVTVYRLLLKAKGNGFDLFERIEVFQNSNSYYNTYKGDDTPYYIYSIKQIYKEMEKNINEDPIKIFEYSYRDKYIQNNIRIKSKKEDYIFIDQINKYAEYMLKGNKYVYEPYCKIMKDTFEEFSNIIQELNKKFLKIRTDWYTIIADSTFEDYKAHLYKK